MTGTAFGSLASAKAQTDKISEQMANTTICDILLDVYQILGIANNKRWLGIPCLTYIKGKPIYNRVLIRKEQI